MREEIEVSIKPANVGLNSCLDQLGGRGVLSVNETQLRRFWQGFMVKVEPGRVSQNIIHRICVHGHKFEIVFLTLSMVVFQGLRHICYYSPVSRVCINPGSV